ncbi:GNAT family N-acetyltransferase [Xylanimonas sp. McL0601]|uniref:GNAT family N-acetyltransferase n=1 Tax=Xylanimonas sp. McL0601 TaxID=3414739 RepID=UPI003CF0FB29
MTVCIDQAHPSEVVTCAGIIAAALLDDPVLRTFVPEGRDRLARLTELHVAALRIGPLHGGAIDVAREHPGGPVLGVAAWEGPHPTASWWTITRELPRLLHAVGSQAPQALRTQRVFDAARPRVPHWFLADIAVAPGAQGLGAGSALLRHRLGAIDATEPLPAYLEATTASSRRLYERFGFEAGAELPVPGAPTAMLRPRAAETA